MKLFCSILTLFLLAGCASDLGDPVAGGAFGLSAHRGKNYSTLYNDRYHHR